MDKENELSVAELLPDDTVETTVGYRRFEGEYEPAAGREEEPPEGGGEPGEEGAEGAEEEPPEDQEGGEPGAEGEDHGIPKGSPELEEERKDLLRMVSDKMKGVGALKIKAQLVDQIHQNPEETLRYLAEKYGVDLGGSAPESPPMSFEVQDVAPKKDEELHSYVGRLVQANLKPVMEAMTKAAKPTPAPAPKKAPGVMGEAALEAALKHLNETYSDWGLYEDRMTELVTKHRSLMNDPDELYRLAKATSTNVSDKAKAKKTVKAKEKMERPSKKVSVTTPKGKVMSFGECWDRAKADLRGK